MPDENHFARIHALGYDRLTPIIPPGAPISERSSLAKRLKAGRDDRGKTPGVKWPDGSWSGFDFVRHESTVDDLDRWYAMGAGVGIKTGRGLVLIDADTIDEDLARIIKDEIERQIGQLPVRIGRYPKAGYLVRTDEDFRYARITFGDERVEILAEGRQFVAHGIHPGTKKPYRWPRGLPPASEVPFASTETLHGLLDALTGLLPAATEMQREGAAADVDQNALRGDWDLIEKAVKATPNDGAFPTREAWLQFGYAIKAAAGPERERDALHLFQDWSETWTEGENDPDYVAAEFGRCKPPFKVGISYLCEKAELASGGSFNGHAERWFEPVKPGEEAPKGPTYEILSIDDILDLPDPKFLIDRHVPEGGLGFLYGDPGTGKSFIALDWALHLAYGKPDWCGDRIDKKDRGCVIYIAGEGVSGIKTRVAAWKHAHNIEAGQKGRFGLIRQSVNFMAKDDVKRLYDTVRDVVAGPVDMIVVDTVSRAMPGADENLQKEMTLFVRSCELMQKTYECAVLGVHHTNKSGDMRGSTVLTGAGDFVFKLERKKGKIVGHLLCEKQKDAPDGWSDNYRFDTIVLGEKASSLVVARCGAQEGESTPLTPELTKSILGAMQTAWDSGDPWSLARNAKVKAVERMVRDFGLDVESAEDTLRVWLGSGTVEESVRSKKNRAKGLRLAEGTDGLSGSRAGDDVFG